MLPPGGTIRPDGTPHHGWLTSLLPYLDSSPTYSMIDFDESWNHRANADVFAYQHPTMRNPLMPEPEDRGRFGVTHYLGNPRLLHRNSSVTWKDIDQGLSHQWMMGAVRGEFPPAAYPFNWRDWEGTVNSSHAGYSDQFLLADGSVRVVREPNVEKTWTAWNSSPPRPSPEDVAIPPYTFDTHGRRFGFPTIAFQTGERLEVFLRLAAEFDKIPHPIGPDDIVAAIAEAHETYPEATELTLQTELTDKLANKMPAFQELQSLFVRDVETTPSVIAALQRCPKLRRLVVRNISAENVQDLREQLRALDVEISWGNVGDEFQLNHR